MAEHTTRTPGAFSPICLRDYFAMEAMSGMLAHSTRYKPRDGTTMHWHDALSHEAYAIADAMLTARDEDAQEAK